MKDHVTRIGILGGAFDPITTGHMQIANAALNAVRKKDWDPLISEVWFMPCSGHAFGKKMLPAEIRMEMIRKVIHDAGSYKICEYEVNNKSNGIAYETLSEFKNRFRDLPLEFYYIIGADNTQSIEKWVNWENLIKEFKFMIVPRKGYEIADWAKEEPHVSIEVQGSSDISSTKVREAIAKGDYKKARRIVYPSVADYIEEHKLYR